MSIDAWAIVIVVAVIGLLIVSDAFSFIVEMLGYLFKKSDKR